MKQCWTKERVKIPPHQYEKLIKSSRKNNYFYLLLLTVILKSTESWDVLLFSQKCIEYHGNLVSDITAFVGIILTEKEEESIEVEFIIDTTKEK